MICISKNRLLLGSILLNLALLGWIMTHRDARTRQSDPSAPTTDSLPTKARTAKGSANQIDSSLPAATNPPTRFDWRQVESPDYKEYIANLRAIGCPEKTINDIITADVNDLFATRRAAITSSNHYEYWKVVPVDLAPEQRAQLQALYGEKAEILKALGVTTYDYRNLVGDYYRDQVESKDLEVEFLVEPKRQQIKDLLLHAAQQQLAAGEGNAVPDFEAQTDAAIKSLLTPEEYHDYQLRTSVPAGQLRAVLGEVQVTESEFRTIFDQWQTLNANPPGSPEYRAAQKTHEAALSSLLGTTRFESYLKGVKLLGYRK